MNPKVYNRRNQDQIPKGTIYVGHPSKWGNPYRTEIFTRERAIKLYANSIEGYWNPKDAGDLVNEAAQIHNAFFSQFIARYNSTPAEFARIELAGKNLSCWCAPLPCHADVLLAVANKKILEKTKK